MSRQRPGSVTAAAVMTIIYGGLFTLCNLCGLFGLAAQGANKNLFAGGNPQQAEVQKQMEDALDRDVPLYRVAQIVAPIGSLVFALALLCAGIGLLGMYSWARLLAIVAALCTVLFNCVQMTYQLVFLLPAMNRVFADVLPNAMPKGGPPPPIDVVKVVNVSMMAGMVIGVLIQLAVIAYLLVIVFMLLRRPVRAAFAGDHMPEAMKGLPDREEEEEGWGKSAPPEKPSDDTRIH
jgi:hypothetical protein